MEAKKNPKADLGRFAGLFFEIGLVVAFCAVLGAFSYTVQEKKLADLLYYFIYFWLNIFLIIIFFFFIHHNHILLYHNCFYINFLF